MTSRRTFLRVLGSAIVGAVVAPALPSLAALPVAPSTFTTRSAASAGALTLEMLERAYREASIGRHAPQCLVMHRSVARRLGLIYDVEIGT